MIEQISSSEYEKRQLREILQVCEEFFSSTKPVAMVAKVPEVGDEVTLSERRMPLSGDAELECQYKKGVVRFVGEVEFKEGTRFGIELTNCRGENNGTLFSIQYFSTENDAMNGVFVMEDKILAVNGVQKAMKISDVLQSDIAPAEIHGKVIIDRDIKDWAEPDCVAHCAQKARKKYTNIPAHEYEDDRETLLAKIKVLGDLIKKSENCCIYSGAGLSTASGINDYASKAGTSSKINVNRKKTKSNKQAWPNIGHRTFATLAQKGLIQNWIQQNHDGLPQKAGFPQHRINEIHGAWFDPSNPVVPMSGSLRDDLFDWFEKIRDESDLVIAVGTSLSGMSADAVFEKACKKWKKGESLGGVIIGLQQTEHDADAYLRIFARIDVVVSLLARELQIVVPKMRVRRKLDIASDVKVKRHVFRVPYDSDGNLTEDEVKMVLWDLSPGAKVKVTQGPGKSFEGTVRALTDDMYYPVSLPIQRQGSEKFGTGSRKYALGVWWIETCTKGLWPKLPIVNIKESLKFQVEIMD